MPTSQLSSPIRTAATDTAAPFTSFADAAPAILSALRASIGFDLWMVTRLHNNDLTVQSIVDRYYGIKAGDVLSWSDSLCKPMRAGAAPRIAPATRHIAADAGVSETYPIAAYIGVPIANGNGQFIGTLCAFNPVAMDADTIRHEPLIEAAARCLATLLHRERANLNQFRNAELAEAKKHVDHETGVQTERGWRELLTGEEIRCAELSDQVGVLVVSLDDLRDTRVRVGRPSNDWILRRGIEIIRIHLPADAIVARIGVEQIAAIVHLPSGDETLKETLDALKAGLDDCRINYSIGFQARDSQGGLLEAWRVATQVLGRPINGLAVPNPPAPPQAQ